MRTDSDKPMQSVMSVLAHPDRESFCAALHREFADEWERSSGTSVSGQLFSIDLYREDFQPVMELAELRRHFPIDRSARDYLRTLEHCRELLLFFPDWWGAEPAILKGFFDRVFRQGVAYDRGEDSKKNTEGLLNDCGLSLWICSDSSGEQLKALNMHYEQRFRSLVGYCGFRSLDLHICSPLRGSNIRKRREWLENCRDVAGVLIAKNAN